MREALRLMKLRDQIREAELRDLRAAIEVGINSGPAEPMEDMDEIINEARARRASRLKQSDQN